MIFQKKKPNKFIFQIEAKDVTFNYGDKKMF